MMAMQQRSNSYLIKVFTLLFIILIIEYIDRSAISFAIHPISASFHLTKTQFGMLASSFSLGYIIMTIGGGLLVDKKNARIVLTVSLILWSIVAIAFGLSNTILLLWINRILLGLFEGPSFACVTQAVAYNISARSRVLIMAITLAAVPFSSVIGAPLVSNLIRWFDWRIVYILMGITGLLLAIIWYFLYKDNLPITQTNSVKKKLNYFAVIRQPALVANCVGYFAYGYVLFFLLFWLPNYFQHTYHLGLREIGWILTIPWLSGTVFMLCGGFLSDYIFTKTNSFRFGRSYVIFISQLLAALSFTPLLFHPSLTMTILWLTLGSGFGLLATPVFNSVNIDLAKDYVGESQGTMNSFFAIAGIIAPVVTGYLAEKSNNFDSAISVVIIVLLVAVATIFIFQRPKESLANLSAKS
jgi:ACS family hexuronate transporter-like MFS transporter